MSVQDSTKNVEKTCIISEPTVVEGLLNKVIVYFLLNLKRKSTESPQALTTVLLGKMEGEKFMDGKKSRV